MASRTRVLIVDDERMIADTLAIILARAGYESRAAYCGEAVVETMLSWHPHLAILDVVLLGMTGIELAARLKEACPECHIMLISGHTATEELLKGAAAEAAFWTVLPKPIPPSELLSKASAALQGVSI